MLGCGSTHARSRATVARYDVTKIKRFSVTGVGFIGLVPLETETGDKVVAFTGADVLFVVRDICDCNVVVGEHYIHGFMHGGVCQSPYHGWPAPDGQSMQWSESGYNDRICHWTCGSHCLQAASVAHDLFS